MILVLYADFVVCCLGYFVFRSAGLSILLLLQFDGVCLGLITLRSVVVYAIHLINARQDVATAWVAKSWLVYHIDVFAELLTFAMTQLHYAHLAWAHGVSFSLVNLVLAVQARVVFTKAAKRWTSFVAYSRLVRRRSFCCVFALSVR